MGAHPGGLHPGQALRACYQSTVPSSIAETVAILLLVAVEELADVERVGCIGATPQPEHPQQDCESRLRSIDASSIRVAMELVQAA